MEKIKKNGTFSPHSGSQIYAEVIARNKNGKGVDLNRTTKNMLSSQAMCFNLFAPLKHDKNFAKAFLGHLLGNVDEIIGSIEYEFTPSKTIFNDQSGKGGVDCDALLKYKDVNGNRKLLVIETKFVEPEFSNCGFRQGEIENQCPRDTNVASDFSNCRYHYKKKYNYWKVAEESNIFIYYKVFLCHNSVTILI